MLYPSPRRVPAGVFTIDIVKPMPHFEPAIYGIQFDCLGSRAIAATRGPLTEKKAGMKKGYLDIQKSKVLDK